MSIAEDLAALEKLASQDGFFQSLRPWAKIGAAFVYIGALVSFDRHALGQMTPFLLYPVLAGVWLGLPLALSLRRLAPALPFCLFAGLSNIVFEKDTALFFWGIPVSYGLVSFFSLLLRTLLCVEAVLLLAATTPVHAIMAQLRRFGLPPFVVSLLEMTYRYIPVPVHEAKALLTAYQMRGGGSRGVDIRHTGSFIGSLFLRSASRAENIANAIKLRSFHGLRSGAAERIRAKDIFFFGVLSVSSLVFRSCNIPLAVGNLWYSLSM
jgi:cobalt/nickel transport system permease protein